MKTNYTRGTLKEKDKLITKLEREVCHKKLILEKILTESIEKKWDQNLKILSYTMSDIDILGVPSRIFDSKEIVKTISELLATI